MVKILLLFFYVTTITSAICAQTSVAPFTETSVPTLKEADPGADKVEDTPTQISKIKTFLAPFVYVGSELRNPFQNQGGAAPLNPGEVYGPFLNVQDFTLSQFKLKGLLWKTDRPMALFEGPKGEQYRLGIKDYIGENFGYIATIREKEVVIIQTIEENQKRYSTTKVVFLNE